MPLLCLFGVCPAKDIIRCCAVKVGKNKSHMGCFFAVCAISTHTIKYYARRGSDGRILAESPRQEAAHPWAAFFAVCAILAHIIKYYARRGTDGRILAESPRQEAAPPWAAFLWLDIGKSAIALLNEICYTIICVFITLKERLL